MIGICAAISIVLIFALFVFLCIRSQRKARPKYKTIKHKTRKHDRRLSNSTLSSRPASSMKSSSSSYTALPKSDNEKNTADTHSRYDDEDFFIDTTNLKRHSINKTPPMSLKANMQKELRQHRAVQSVAVYDESQAESSMSDFDYEEKSVSAYGDRASVISDNGSAWASASNAQATVSIQMSLIYSRDMKYVAGKVIQVDGLVFPQTAKAMTGIKVHIVVQPMKKYALKTNWYPLNDYNARLDEYFKFKFKDIPTEGNVMFRFRVYGRTKNFSRALCIGECYINLREIVTSRGGLTIWRPITKGAPEAVVVD